jgi:hypothetical protein
MKYHPFGIAAKSGGPEQLDLFAPVPDYVLGPKQVHPYSGDIRWVATWKGDYAGDINPPYENPDKFEASADLGYRLYGHGAGSSHWNYLGEFDTLAAAAAALEKRVREVRADPLLIWSTLQTKENIAKAKANGWWRKKAS